MNDIDSVLNQLNPRGGRKDGLSNVSVATTNPTLVVLVVLVILAAFAAGFAISISPRDVVQAREETPNQAATEKLWELLMKEMPTCAPQESNAAMNTPELRTVGLFAAARFNCTEVVHDLIARGADLNEKRYIKGLGYTLEDYAGQYGAIEVVKLIQEERANREKELAKMAKQLQAEKKDPAHEAEERRRMSVQTLLAEEATLQKSIHYERARLDCEALRERLGYSADLVHMTDCIRKQIATRRAERKELGHVVPR